MPVPIGPLKFVCPRCYWQRTIHMASDVLIQPTWAKQCPQCGFAPLKAEAGRCLPGLLGQVVARVLRKFV